MNSAPAGGRHPTSVGEVKTGTLEAVFNATGAPRLLLDTRIEQERP